MNQQMTLLELADRLERVDSREWVLLQNAAAELRWLVEENKKLKEDADRYRWISAYCESVPEDSTGRWSIIVEGPCKKTLKSEASFDRAIDAAIRKSEASFYKSIEEARKKHDQR